MNNERIPYLKLLPLIFITIVLFKSVNSLQQITDYIQVVISILIPLIWAMVIAYLVNPLIVILDRKTKFGRSYNILLVYLVLTGIIALIAVAVIPRIVLNITELIDNLPEIIENLEVYLTEWFANLSEYSFAKYIEIETVNEYIGRLSSVFDIIISTALNSLLSVSTGVFKFVMGFVISIYILKDKELFGRGFRKLFFAKFSETNAERILEFSRDSDRIFSRFLIGKFIDSVIIGIIAFAGFYLLKAPYPLLLSLIIGITNMIPYFGPFIGAVPVTVITLFFDPILSLWVVAFIFALQQFDGYILGPKILGKSLGLSPFWIILAILIGGGLFGVIGMLIGVPIMAIIKNMVTKHIDKELNKKEMEIM
jgi:predicted PurR-regulated permease PerM